MRETPKDRRVGMSVLNGGLHALLLVIELFLLLFVVPLFGEMYCDFGAELPMVTRVLLDLSHLFQWQWFRILPVCGLLIAGSTMLFPHLYKARRAQAWMWCLSVVLFQLLLIGVTIAAMYAPLLKMSS